MTATPDRPCPKCHVPLILSQRRGIGIDYCPQCSGVWLERDEQDKVIARSSERNLPLLSADLHLMLWQGPSSDGHERAPNSTSMRRRSFLEDLFE
jgi:uncharacterized protein